MKIEPLITMPAVALAAPAFGINLTPDFLAAVFAGGVATCIFSVIKSRLREAPKLDANLWLVLQGWGAMAFGLFAAPELAGREILGMTMPGLAFCAFFLTLSGGPIVEWLLAGAVVKYLKKRAGKGDLT